MPQSNGIEVLPRSFSIFVMVVDDHYPAKTRQRNPGVHTPKQLEVSFESRSHGMILEEGARYAGDNQSVCHR